MKSIYCMIAFVIFLAACAPATPTVQSPVVSTSVPPNPTTAPTVKPSPTVDPNIPEASAGVTVKKDAQGYIYTDENGVTYRFTKLTDSNDEVKWQGWFTSHIKNGSLNGNIPLVDQPADGFTQTIPFSMDFIAGVNGPNLQHPDNPASSDAPNFTRTLLSRLMERYYGKSNLRMSADEVRSFYENLYQGLITIPFSTPTGNFEWKPGPSIGVKFYAVAWDDTDPAKNSEFNETMDEIEGKSLTYRWTVFTDTDGNLMIVAAVKDPLQLSDNQLFGWILHPMEFVIKEQQIPANVRGWGFPTYPSELVSSINRGLSPEFIIISDQ